MTSKSLNSAATTDGARPAVAYLVSQYPMLSMIFIIREVVRLRELGFRIDVASINAPDRSREGLTAVEAAESDLTYVLKQHGLKGAIAAHMTTLLATPASYARGLALVVRLSQLDLKRYLFNFVYLTESLMVGRWMKKVGQRHLHVHLGSQAATVGMFVKAVFGYGLSITVHGPDEFYHADGQYLRDKVEASDFICCISFFARSQLMKLSDYAQWKKLVVSRLGIDPEVFTPVPVRRHPDVFEILCVGRLTPAKGQHLLVEAAGELMRRGRQVRLRVIGAGVDADSLKEQAAKVLQPESVVFEGAVNQDRIRELYAMADVFCIPSFAEGIPVVLMEAMAMGIPCVSTQITGIPELIENGESGLLVAPSDLKGLVGALEKLMDDPDLRERLAVNGRRQIIDNYDLKRNIDRLAEIFTERIQSL